MFYFQEQAADGWRKTTLYETRGGDLRLDFEIRKPTIYSRPAFVSKPFLFEKPHRGSAPSVKPSNLHPL
jgi:hypothetical protein